MEFGAKVPEGIRWHDWNRDAFELAAERGVPVLLSISASWCHWCHVLDGEAFSDPEVISVVNSDYVPIRVDTDVRPDVNSVYNMGGWPTVALLDHDGQVLSGATYLPTTRMLEWLRRTVATFPMRVTSRQRSDSIKKAPAHIAGYTPTLRPRSDVLSWMRREYDEVHGGFGTEPKFPMFDCLALAIDEYAATGDSFWAQVFKGSLAAMTGRGTYDAVEGGLFRYSTTRDWSVPHFEKMLLDNALLLSVCGRGYAATSEGWLIDVAERTYDYLKSTLFMDVPGAFAGSQDADESYYRLQTRRLREASRAPSVDRRIYADWNSVMANALITCGRTMHNQSWVDHGVSLLRRVHDLCFDAVNGMAHVWHGRPSVWGLAHDTIAYGAACLSAYSATGDALWKERSLLLASRLVSTHGMGGIVTRLKVPDDPPGFERPIHDFHENAYAAIWLVGASALADSRSDADTLRSTALNCLAVCDRLYPSYGIHGAAYGIALGRYLRDGATESATPEGITCDGGVCRPTGYVPPHASENAHVGSSNVP